MWGVWVEVDTYRTSDAVTSTGGAPKRTIVQRLHQHVTLFLKTSSLLDLLVSRRIVSREMPDLPRDLEREYLECMINHLVEIDK